MDDRRGSADRRAEGGRVVDARTISRREYNRPLLQSARQHGGELLSEYDNNMPADYNLARAGFAIARALRDLGNADADTNMGGLEGLGKVMTEGFERLAGSIDRLAEAIEAQSEEPE